MSMKAIQGDITVLKVDAIVNAANRTLLGGCPAGEARITGSHGLPAKYIIHAVGPAWSGGGEGEAGLLRSCYLNALALAREKGLSSIAFPCISTGIFGYPRREAAGIAVAAVREFLKGGYPLEVVFCCFLPEDLAVYEGLLGQARD
ncbi:MAG: macro domain-containing protein [Elusimicrobia bacterium]|nr:macro domain-containing protein [Elusimicrobiota bacterium]